MHKKLLSLVGQSVGLINEAYNDSDDTRINIHVVGTLEVTEEPGTPAQFYVRVADNAAGASGISFRASHVLDIHRQVYNHEITIR